MLSGRLSPAYSCHLWHFAALRQGAEAHPLACCVDWVEAIWTSASVATNLEMMPVFAAQLAQLCLSKPRAQLNRRVCSGFVQIRRLSLQPVQNVPSQCACASPYFKDAQLRRTMVSTRLLVYTVGNRVSPVWAEKFARCKPSSLFPSHVYVQPGLAYACEADIIAVHLRVKV